MTQYHKSPRKCGLKMRKDCNKSTKVTINQSLKEYPIYEIWVGYHQEFNEKVKSGLEHRRIQERSEKRTQSSKKNH